MNPAGILQERERRIGVTPAYECYLCVAPPRGDARKKKIRVYASWRALSGHAARETIYYKDAILDARVGRTPPRRTHSTGMPLCDPERELRRSALRGESARFSRAESHRAAEARQRGAAWGGGAGRAPKGGAAADAAAPARPGLQMSVEVCIAECPARPGIGRQAASDAARQPLAPARAAPRRGRPALAARPSAGERRGAGP
ncbi:unnamed protein product [Prorocentrum cordatum]|uniref:Uncharacterized protein n=1 Tax=Prorocentrum cordatum TaxID=2364126 RepID=A0ABN9S9K7_9DINO|nr:unnamed protein product [Polarella glacialis]